MQMASSRAVCCTGDALRNRSVERGHGGVGGRLWSQPVVIATKYGRERSSWNPVCCQSSWPRCLDPLCVGVGGRGMAAWSQSRRHRLVCPSSADPSPDTKLPEQSSGLGLAIPIAVPDPMERPFVPVLPSAICYLRPARGPLEPQLRDPSSDGGAMNRTCSRRQERRCLSTPALE